MRLYRVDDDEKFVEYAPEVFAADHVEATLQSWLEENPDAIIEDGRLLLIGREVTTNLGKSIDLLALDRDGDVVVIELKRDETPRTTLAQALEYAAFASALDHDALREIYRSYLRSSERHLSEDHRAYFELADDEAVSFNKEQRIVIVGRAISPQVRETASYLRRKGLLVTCVEFSYFKTAGGEQLLSTDIVVGLEPVTTEVTSSAAANWMTEERFLATADYSRPVFEGLLAMAQEQSFPVRWGTKGFSLNTTVGGRRVVLYFGYPPGTGNANAYTLYTDFAGLAWKVEGGPELIEQTKVALSASGLWRRAGKELKIILDRPLKDEELTELTSQALRLSDEIRRRGLAPTDSEDDNVVA